MMDDSFEKENSVSIVSSSALHSSSIIGQPLTSKQSANSLNSVGGLILPIKSDTGSISPKKKMDSNVLNLQKEYKRLERSYTDLILKNKDLLSENSQYEAELMTKGKIVNDQSTRISAYEKLVRSVQQESRNSRDHFEREISFYKDQIFSMQITIDRLFNEVEEYKASTGSVFDSNTKYDNLMKDFKVLKSNFEIEQKSKSVLIDQIEFLSKQNENITNQLQAREDDDNKIQQELFAEEREYDTTDRNSIIHNFSVDSNDEFSDDENLEEMEGTQMLSYLADELKNNHSSPMKSAKDNSFEVSNNFQFPSKSPVSTTDKSASNIPRLNNTNNLHMPPSPDPISRDLKRQSLPAQLKGSAFDQNDDFILSPFKLSNNTASYFDGDTSIAPSKKRYSGFKSNHSRYNSHDIFPIKVEFEESESNMRSTSAPEKEHLTKIESVDEAPDSAPAKRSVRNSTFSILNGESYGYSNRNSLNTNSSSKRSSLLMESPMTNDMTRQEIMKLKFELQSLKLHNEKLLSYIGFELQKQKKNIHKLSSRQSLNDPKKRMEYSDAKLIEKSRNMLIRKKRVLRSVSINPIISKHYQSSNMGIISKGLINNGFVTFNDKIFNSELSGLEQSENEDDYGFMNHNDNFSRRIFSNALQSYLNYDEIDDDALGVRESDAQIKKYKSQILVGNIGKESYSDTSLDEFNDSTIDDISEDFPINSPHQSGMFNHIKGLLFGSGYLKGKQKKSEEKLVDDSLKYKFFTLVVGLMIVSLKLSHRSEQLQLGH